MIDGAINSGRSIIRYPYRVSELRDSSLLVFKTPDRPIKVPPELTVILDHVHGSTTLKQILFALRKSFHGTVDEDLVCSCLHELLDLGLIVYQDDFLSSLTDNFLENPIGPGHDESRPITTIGVMRSGGGPVFAEKQWSRYLCDFDPDCSVTVFEDRGGRRPEYPLQYHGPTERRVLVDSVIRKVSKEVPRENVEFGLLGDLEWSYRLGANRNTCLLAQIGELILMSDADQGNEFAVPPEARAVIEIASGKIPFSIHAFRSLREVVDFAGESRNDLFEQHHLVLGKTVRSCLTGSRKRLTTNVAGVVFNNVSSSLLDSIIRLSPRVIATTAGVLGDTGFGSPRATLFLHGKTRERAFSSCETYTTTLKARFACWSSNHPVITDNPVFRPGHSGYDTRTLLPPFPPIGRNQGGVWGQLVSRCYPPGCIAHIPAAVVHKPDQPRRFKHEDLFDLSLRSNDVLSIILQMLPQTALFPLSPDAALRTLGYQLQSLGTAREDHFRDAIRHAWAVSAAREIDRCNEALVTYDSSPDFWADDVEQLAECYHQSIMDGFPQLMVDHEPTIRAGHGDRQQQLSAAQDYIRRFGTLLTVWPEIDTAARAVRERKQ